MESLDDRALCHYPYPTVWMWGSNRIWLFAPLSTLFLLAFIGFYQKGSKINPILLLDQLLSRILLIKLYFVRCYMALYDRFLAQKGFRLKSAQLRSSIPDLHCVVIDCFKTFSRRMADEVEAPKKIRPSHFRSLCEVHGCDPDSSYLQLHYQYNEQSYTFIYTHQMAEMGVVVEYPLYHDEKIRDFKADLCHPHFTKPDSKNSLYSLFGIDCKGIKGVRFNGDPDHPFNPVIGERIMGLKGPLNDFGYLYQGDTRVQHLLDPHHTKEFRSLEIEYVAPYLDEETFDIVPHVIQVESLNDRLLSPRMKSVLENRKKSERAGDRAGAGSSSINP